MTKYLLCCLLVLSGCRTVLQEDCVPLAPLHPDGPGVPQLEAQMCVDFNLPRLPGRSCPPGWVCRDPIDTLAVPGP